MLGQPISMVLPEVVGYKLLGNPQPLVTSTDIVLTITKVMNVPFFVPLLLKTACALRATVLHTYDPQVYFHVVVLVLWTYCSVDWNQLPKFAMQICFPKPR